MLIADHCTHYTVATLLGTLAAAGFRPIVMRTDVVSKEITVLAERGSNKTEARRVRSGAPEIDSTRAAVANALGWLQVVLAEATLIARSDNFGLFGTAISANWLLGELRDRVKLFVDEDPSRIGTTYYGCPVMRPQNAPSGSDVFMVLPRFLAEQIIARIKPEDARFHLSPEYKAVMKEAPYVVGQQRVWAD